MSTPRHTCIDLVPEIPEMCTHHGIDSQARLAAMAASLEERERLYKDIEARLGGKHTHLHTHMQ